MCDLVLNINFSLQGKGETLFAKIAMWKRLSNVEEIPTRGSYPKVPPLGPNLGFHPRIPPQDLTRMSQVLVPHFCYKHTRKVRPRPWGGT